MNKWVEIRLLDYENENTQESKEKLESAIVFYVRNNGIGICDGVNGYITKPTDINQLMKTIQLVIGYWFETAILPNAARRQK